MTDERDEIDFETARPRAEGRRRGRQHDAIMRKPTSKEPPNVADGVDEKLLNAKIGELRQEFKAEMASITGALKTEIATQIGALRNDFTKEFAATRETTSKEIHAVDVKIEKLTTQVQMWGVFLGVVVPIVIMVVNHLWK